MRSPAKALVRRKNLQPCSASTSAPKAARPGPHLNALKHGLRSGHVLLPGDNVAEFRKLRHRLFHLHQPRTVAEAKQVETLAANQWRAARCRMEHAFFKEHLGAAMSGHPDATGYLCNPDLHRLHHRGTDCQKEERRLEKSMAEAEATLAVLQKQRTQNLNPRLAAVLEPYEVFLAEGEPVVEEPALNDGAGMETPREVPSAEAAETAATDSADGRNSIGSKPDSGVPARRFPRHWSRQQREAALRRMGGNPGGGNGRAEGYERGRVTPG